MRRLDSGSRRAKVLKIWQTQLITSASRRPLPPLQPCTCSNRYSRQWPIARQWHSRRRNRLWSILWPCLIMALKTVGWISLIQCIVWKLAKHHVLSKTWPALALSTAILGWFAGIRYTCWSVSRSRMWVVLRIWKIGVNTSATSLETWMRKEPPILTRLRRNVGSSHLLKRWRRSTRRSYRLSARRKELRWGRRRSESRCPVMKSVSGRN